MERLGARTNRIAAAVGPAIGQSSYEVDDVILYHLGAALLGAGQPAAAHVKFARVLSLDPAFPTAREIRTVLARR